MREGREKIMYKKWWIYLVSAIAVMGMVSMTGCGSAAKDETKTENAQSTEKVENAETENKADESKEENNAPKDAEKPADNGATTDASTVKVTFDTFSNIKLGDSYDSIIALIGEGEQIDSEDGQANYKWVNGDSSVVALTFDNNVLVGKIQSGLKKMDCNVTLDAYNSLSEEEGTYDDMLAKLGEPQVMAENNLNGISYTTYEYVNSDNSRAEITICDGVVVAKEQSNLK